MAGPVVNVFGPGRAVTVLDGDSFCVSDARGDFDGGHSGFFSGGTRFLSEYRILVDGQSPEPLGGGGDEHFRASFYLEPPHNPHQRQELALSRRRTVVGAAFEDEIELHNYGDVAVSVMLSVSFGADFGAIGKLGEGSVEVTAERSETQSGGHSLQFTDPEGSITQVVLSVEAEISGGQASWSLSLAPRASWVLRVHVNALLAGDAPFDAARFDVSRERTVSSYRDWKRERPELVCSWSGLEAAYDRSVFDLAALRMRDPRCDEPMVAAGLPWFMTVFGRDSLITCLQTISLGDDLARSTLRVLAALQAQEDDARIDAEPGKILHELRRGKAAERWFPLYYGSVDATPLWLVLLSELHLWSGDDDFVRELEAPARRALSWLDDWGDLDGDGFIEFEPRAKALTGRGLSVQTWKDSQYSQVFRDGSLAETPIAAAEVQGYAYDAYRRSSALARVWGDERLAGELEVKADRLYQAFNEAFWLERDGYYALALDREKRPVDALASNIGHLLWSGIVPVERAARLAEHLVGPSLFSGWGVRSLGADQGGYNPLVYHNGCVWPHDTSLAAWGLARYGRRRELFMLAQALLEAAGLFEDQLPELFAGYARADVPFPVSYPATCKPQAWAAGVPVLFTRLLLGLEPGAEGLTATREPPGELEGLRLTGVPARGRRWDVVVEGGRTEIREAR